jgi:catechol 2,3-dioxygenase
MPIGPSTTVGRVALTVRDLDQVAAFYERVVGLDRVETDPGTVRLGVAGETLVELVSDPDAPPRARGTTGLYHLAILVPSRGELARAVQRTVDARWPLAGAADHLVSEALYLDDPEGNGIEIYRDRPRDAWRRDGSEIAMATLPLDLRAVMARHDGSAGGIAAGTTMGHVHLQVAELETAERFYGTLLGFEVTARGYPGALFLAAGGYHHHIGVNTWASRGAPPPGSGSTGLRDLEIVVADERERSAIVERLVDAGIPIERRGDATLVKDPSQNVVALVSRR